MPALRRLARQGGQAMTESGKRERLIRRAINELAADAELIGRRTALRLLERWKSEVEALVIDDFRSVVSSFVAAEILTSMQERASGLTAPAEEAEIVIRLGYSEAVQAVTAIIEAMDPRRPATELDTLAELRTKFYCELGLFR